MNKFIEAVYNCDEIDDLEKLLIFDAIIWLQDNPEEADYSTPSKKCQYGCDELSGSFVWGNSPQGHHYWDSIYLKLEKDEILSNEW